MAPGRKTTALEKNGDGKSIQVISPDSHATKRDSRQVSKDVAAGDAETSYTQDNLKRFKGVVPTIDVGGGYSVRAEILPDGTPPVNLRGAHPELFVENLQGDIDIVWCNDGNKEGFIDPFMKAIFSYDRKDPKAVKVMEEAKKKTGIFAAAGRRVSRKDNQVQMKQGNNGVMYKLTYLIRQTNSNKSASARDNDRRQCLEYIAEFLNAYNKNKEGLYGNSSAVFQVPADFNRTPMGGLACWDDRLLDEDVARIMRLLYFPSPDKNFAQSGCSTVKAHYSPPYCKIAKEEFGYGGGGTGSGSGGGDGQDGTRAASSR